MDTVDEESVRKYGPPPGWVGAEPTKESEIFIGKIPIDVFKDELVPLCQQFGEIYELRLISRTSDKAYALVKYIKREEAENAVQQLDQYEIREEARISVCKATENRRIFISGLPKNKSKEDILNEIRNRTDGVIGITVIEFFPQEVFVTYDSPAESILAENILDGKRIFRKKVKVKQVDATIQFDDVTNERVPHADSSALDGTASSDQMPVLVDFHGIPIICSCCKHPKQENDGVRFIKASCRHFYCKTCSNYIFNVRNPVKPHKCLVCNKTIKSRHNKRVTGYVPVDD